MILGIDTSLGTAVGIVDRDGAVLAERASENPLGHAENIGDLLQGALADAEHGLVGGTGPAQSVGLTYVAAGMGPGPFTGLRVGIAAARAFALGRGLPVIAVPSHDAAALGILLAAALADPFAELGTPVPPAADAARGASGRAGPPRFAVVTDARRREVAYSVYEGADADGLPVRTAGPALAPRTEIDAVLAELDADRRDVTAISGALLGIVAARAIAAGRELTGPEPLYLRAPDVTLPGAPKRVST